MSLLPPLRAQRRDPHMVTLVIAPASMSRDSLSITVHQNQDAAGHYLMPTITFSKAIPQTTEDVVLMKSIAEGLLWACLEAIEMINYVE